MMQETKCGPKDLNKLDDFITYEHHRSYEGGGELAISAMRDLNPALVRDGGDHVESPTVDIHVRNITILCTNAYGPQENANISKKRRSI